jgi:hypothetical protein
MTFSSPALLYLIGQGSNRRRPLERIARFHLQPRSNRCRETRNSRHTPRLLLFYAREPQIETVCEYPYASGNKIYPVCHHSRVQKAQCFEACIDPDSPMGP